LVHCKPVVGNFAVQIPVPDGRAFQSRAKRFGAPMGHKVLDGLVDEAAALARLN
jgi:hypothetical protein